MPDEAKNDAGSVEATATNPPVIVVDGVTLTADDVKELKKGSMLERDYRQKTTEIARTREQLEEKEMEIRKREQELVGGNQRGTNSNVASNDVGDDYVDPAVKVLRDQVSSLTDTVKELTNELRGDRTERSRKESASEAAQFEKQVDAAFNSMDKLVDGEFSYASKSGVGAQIETFYRNNKRLPDDKEIRVMTESSHREVYRRTNKPVGEVKPEDSTKSKPTNSTPPVRTALPNRLSDDDSMERRLKTFISERQLLEE